MSKLLIGLASLIAVQVYGAEDLPGNWYRIVSDEYSSALPKNTVIVKGRVLDNSTNNGIFEAYVGTVSQNNYCYTKSDGSYQLEYKTSDSTLYFYHPSYGEAVIWTYDFKSQHIVTIDFYANRQMEEPVMVEKPVIYLYSPKKITANLKLDNEDILSFTYPKYKEDGWKVNIDPAVGISVDNKSYPYLFWDGQMNLNFKQQANGMEGYFIQTDSTVQFLESILADFGLNATESTDFITYWAPRMIVHEFAMIQFFVDDIYADEISGITVSPKPDSQRRVYMVFKGYENDSLIPKLQKPIIEPFVRVGFTLIEWGGSEL